LKSAGVEAKLCSSQCFTVSVDVTFRGVAPKTQLRAVWITDQNVPNHEAN